MLDKFPAPSSTVLVKLSSFHTSVAIFIFGNIITVPASV
jgi:hypothetical protein